MSTIPGLGRLLTEQYRLRPREWFQDRLSRLDAAGRDEYLAEARQPFVLPTRQPDFPSTLEARIRTAREDPFAPANDFAAAVERIRSRRRRVETPDAPVADAPTGPPAWNYADVVHDLRERSLRFSGGEGEARDPAAVGAEPLDQDRVVRMDEADWTRGPRRAFPISVDPFIQKSGLQLFTGAQLDVLI